MEEIRQKYTRKLPEATKEKPIGHNPRFHHLIKQKEYIGWYCEIIKK
jgi:hypothetical protein